MGFDISYHPVDVAFIRDRVVPFVAGRRDIDDLIATGTRIARNRYLAEEAGLTTDLFSDAAELFAPLVAAEPRMQFELYKTIEQNYSLGGYVRPTDVPRLRQFLEANHAKLLAVGAAQGWEYNCGLALKKIREAVRDAEARHYGFIEASEVYSGPLGVMN